MPHCSVTQCLIIILRINYSKLLIFISRMAWRAISYVQLLSSPFLPPVCHSWTSVSGTLIIIKSFEMLMQTHFSLRFLFECFIFIRRVYQGPQNRQRFSESCGYWERKKYSFHYRARIEHFCIIWRVNENKSFYTVSASTKINRAVIFPLAFHLACWTTLLM